MSYEEYIESLQDEMPPKKTGDLLMALWWDAKGEWDKAHQIAQGISEWTGAWVHAYLHRKEGDTWNADYWYSRAGKKRQQISLDEEWSDMVNFFLSR